MALYTRPSSGTITTEYLLLDHLGSVDAITSSTGGVVAPESFSAFGERRNPSTWSGPPSSGEQAAIAGATARGYTFHTNLEASSLVHLNGRVLDAKLGRFLSADPYVPNPGLTQSFNRYSYVNNDALSFTDPSGFVPCFVPQAIVCIDVLRSVFGLFKKKNHSPPKGCQVGPVQCYGQPGVGRTPGFNSLVTPDRLQSLWDFYSCQFHGLCGNGAGTFGGGFPGGGVFGSGPCGEYCLNWGADWETAHEAALILWPGYDLGTCISSSGDCGIIDWTLAGVGIIPGGKGVSSLGKAAIKAGSKVLASRAARAGSQFTRSTLELGQQMHRAYKSDLVNGVTRFKEFVFNTGRRADFIDLEKGTIYELKPNNPRAIREGYKQLEQYLQDARAQFPDIDWTTVLDTY